MADDRKLTPLQLGLLVLYGAEGSRGASPYGVDRLIRSGVGGVLGFAKSSCYVQSKKLAESGHLTATRLEQDRPRPLTLYRLTDKGKRAVERWLRTPAKAPPIDSEAFLRARALSFVAPEVIQQGLRHLRPELTRLLSGADAREVELALRQPPLSDRLQLDLVRSVFQTYLRWLARTEKALAREIRIAEENR